MAIRDWYVDSSVAVNGNGTQAAPFKTLALAAEAIDQEPAGGNHLHLRSGSVFHELVPDRLCNMAWMPLYMDVYDGGVSPVIDATIDCTSSLQYDNNLDWFSAKLGTHDHADQPGKLTTGAVLQDGEPLPMQHYSADHAELRSKLYAGGYSCDWDTGWVYVVPRASADTRAKPEDKPDKPGKPPKPPNPPGWQTEPPPAVQPVAPTFRVAVHSIIMSCLAPGPYGDNDQELNYSFTGVTFIGAKRHAVGVSTTKVLFKNCRFFCHGGQQYGAESWQYLGNGIEFSVSANDCAVLDSDFTQIFDTGVTAQTYGNGQYATNITIDGNTFATNGLFAIELSTQAGNETTMTQDIFVTANHINGNAGCFAPDIYHGRFGGIGVICNAPGSILDDITISGNTIEDMLENGVTITECGEHIYVHDNTFRRCNLGLFFGAEPGNTTVAGVERNTIEDCLTGIRSKSTVDSSRLLIRNNGIRGGEVAFSDGSTASAKVELIGNALDARTAIDCDRTDGITGSGNTSIGDIDPTFTYLFEG